MLSEWKIVYQPKDSNAKHNLTVHADTLENAISAAKNLIVDCIIIGIASESVGKNKPLMLTDAIKYNGDMLT